MVEKVLTGAASLADSRYGDIKDEPVTYLLAPISAYGKADTVSLEELVVPIAHLSDGIEGNAWVAKQNCSTPAARLTPDMSASICLYTKHFQELNKTLRTENRQALNHGSHLSSFSSLRCTPCQFVLRICFLMFVASISARSTALTVNLPLARSSSVRSFMETGVNLIVNMHDHL